VNQQRSLLHQAQQNLQNRLGISASRQFKYVPQLVLEVDASMLNELMKDPTVLRIYEDGLSAPTLINSVEHISADEAWSAGFTGNGQVIAILDTGVDRDHEFLVGKVVSEACYSNAYPPDGGTTLCPNGLQTQLEDYEGHGPAEPCDFGNCGHGTHVAGIAAGKLEGVFSGVAPDAKIIAIQVFTRFDDDPICNTYAGTDAPCILTYDSDTISGLERVYELRDTFNIAAVNLSLGGGEYSDPCDGEPGHESDSREPAIQNLRSVEIATIAAAGNNEFRTAIAAPACIPDAISVGSTTLTDDVSWFSNVADFMDFYAPGSSIYSSLPEDTYGWMNGTSMAAPHVSGAWAVIKSKIPDGSVDFVYHILSSTGVLVDDQREFPNGTVVNIPRIQLDMAIEEISISLIPFISHASPP
jgi:subtilisin family serine protease